MNSTIARITARGLLGRRRVFLLIPLPVIMIAVALLARGGGVIPENWGPPVISGLGFAAVLPVVALIVGTGVLGSEIDDGTITHILAKPLPRSEIILTKLVVSTGITTLIAGVPLFVVGLIAGNAAVAFAVLAAAAVGALTYSALFMAISLLTRRPVLLGLLYVVIWEGVLGNLLAGTQKLSIEQYVISIADWLAPSDLIFASLSSTVSLVMSCIFAVGMTALAIQRLRVFSVAGETG